MISFLLLCFTISLVIFSYSNINAVKSALQLWATSVVPSLFPFFVATELLTKTNLPQIIGKLFNRIMKPFFNVSGEGAFALIMGIISGYPVGAKIACNFRTSNVLEKVECERLLSFTNNSRAFIYYWYCWYKYVWEFAYWFFAFNITYSGLSYSWIYFQILEEKSHTIQKQITYIFFYSKNNEKTQCC